MNKIHKSIIALILIITLFSKCRNISNNSSMLKNNNSEIKYRSSSSIFKKFMYAILGGTVANSLYNSSEEIANNIFESSSFKLFNSTFTCDKADEYSFSSNGTINVSFSSDHIFSDTRRRLIFFETENIYNKISFSDIVYPSGDDYNFWGQYWSISSDYVFANSINSDESDFLALFSNRNINYALQSIISKFFYKNNVGVALGYLLEDGSSFCTDSGNSICSFILYQELTQDSDGFLNNNLAFVNKVSTRINSNFPCVYYGENLPAVTYGSDENNNNLVVAKMFAQPIGGGNSPLPASVQWKLVFIMGDFFGQNINEIKLLSIFSEIIINPGTANFELFEIKSLAFDGQIINTTISIVNVYDFKVLIDSNNPDDFEIDYNQISANAVIDLQRRRSLISQYGEDFENLNFDFEEYNELRNTINFIGTFKRKNDENFSGYILEVPTEDLFKENKNLIVKGFEFEDEGSHYSPKILNFKFLDIEYLGISFCFKDKNGESNLRYHIIEKKDFLIANENCLDLIKEVNFSLEIKDILERLNFSRPDNNTITNITSINKSNISNFTQNPSNDFSLRSLCEIEKETPSPTNKKDFEDDHTKSIKEKSSNDNDLWILAIILGPIGICLCLFICYLFNKNIPKKYNNIPVSNIEMDNFS